MPVKHSFSSAKADGADATIVRPSDWNADHAITNAVVPNTQQFGDAASVGSSVHPALADHHHGVPVNPLTQSPGDETTPTLTTTGSFEFAPATTDYQVRWNGAANATIIGITGWIANRHIIIRNVTTSFYVTLAYENAGASNTNARLSMPGNVDFVIGPRQAVELVWQGTSARWIAIVQSLTPTGSILAFAGTVEPPGWLIANGRAVSRTTFAALFAVIGTVYGVGDGSTTFNLPNMCYDGAAGQGRVPMGRRISGSGAAVGDVFGSIDHTHDGHGSVITDHPIHVGDGTHTHDNHTAAISGGLVGAASGGSSATVGGANVAGAGHQHGPGTLGGTHSSVGFHNHDGHSAHTGTHNTANPPTITVMYIIAT